jgi:hypothetical protein
MRLTSLRTSVENRNRRRLYKYMFSAQNVPTTTTEIRIELLTKDELDFDLNNAAIRRDNTATPGIVITHAAIVDCFHLLSASRGSSWNTNLKSALIISFLALENCVPLSTEFEIFILHEKYSLCCYGQFQFGNLPLKYHVASFIKSVIVLSFSLKRCFRDKLHPF